MLIPFVSSGGKLNPEFEGIAANQSRVSWHQMMRSFLEPWSDFLSFTILRIPKGTLVSRYTRLVLSFWISGMIHVAMGMCYGVHPMDSGAVNFFLMHAGGIMVEDGIQELYRRFGGKPNRWMRGLGYFWTALFFLWTTPSWGWPTARSLIPRGDRSLPFSFAKYFMGKPQQKLLRTSMWRK